MAIDLIMAVLSVLLGIVVISYPKLIRWTVGIYFIISGLAWFSNWLF